MKIIKQCSKGGGCNNFATHCLIYIDATTFKEITNKPKPYCKYHALYLQAEMKKRHGIQSRLITMDEWGRRLESYKSHGGKPVMSKI